MNDGCVPASVSAGPKPASWPASHSYVFKQADLVISTVTLSSKVKPSSKAWLDQAAREVNQVWNYCNDVAHRAWFNHYGGSRKWLSAYDISPLLSGCGETFDRIGIDVAQAVAAEHAVRRNQFKKSKLKWRKSGGARKSPGWIPFKTNGLRFSVQDKNGKRVAIPDDPQPMVPSWPARQPGESKEDYAARKEAFRPVRDAESRELSAWEYRRVQAAHVIKVSFMGKSVRLFQADRLLDAFKLSKQGVGSLRSGNFAQDAVGDWYLNMVVDRVELSLAPLLGSDSSLGLDPGQISAMTGSDGQVLRSRRYRSLEPKIKESQRHGHKRTAKRLHRKARRQRQDDRNKFCRKIVNEYSRIWVGNLDPRKMARSRLRGQAKSTLDAAYGAAFSTLEAMGHRAGRVVKRVDERYSTRRCSACMRLSGPSGLESCVVRQWVCRDCGTTHDRDINSGENLRHCGETEWQNRSSRSLDQTVAPRYWRPFAGTR